MAMLRFKALALAGMLAACAGPMAAQPPSAAELLAPLLGCWRGAFAGNAAISDERCFERLGAHVVDIHAVRPTFYGGETTYHADDATGAIVWAYAANDGGRSNGGIARTARGYAIAPFTHFGANGERYRLRANWVLEGADAFVVETEREIDGRWTRFSQIRFSRAADMEAISPDD